MSAASVLYTLAMVKVAKTEFQKWKDKLQIDTSVKSPKYKERVGLGKSKVNGKWYGWSHRALCGFAPGDVVEKGDVICDVPKGDRSASSFPAGYKIKDDADAERAAACFAGQVA